MKQKLRTHINKTVARNLAIVAASLLLLFIELNLAVYVAYLHRTFPNTRIANFSIGTTNYSALPGKISNLPLLPPAISLGQHGQSSSLSPARLGVQVDSAKIQAAAKRRAWLPIRNFIVPHHLSVAVKIDRQVLTNTLEGLAVGDKHDPADAQIVIQNGQFQLSGSANGYQLNVAQAVDAVAQAVDKQQARVDLPFSNITPLVTSASLLPALQQLQAQQAVALSYSYNGKVTRPSAATIAGWYTLAGNDYVPQSSKIQAYITQIGAGDGIQVENISAAVAATRTALQKTSAMTFVLVAVPPTVCSTNTKSQLILVSITQQHMWACQGPEQVYDSPVTTGAYLAGDATPTGSWHIYAKETNVNLVGPSWNDPVNYWLPFYSDFGFHDASWQTFPFGGPEYPTQGSHGCVHLPLAAMAWLYGWSKIGTAVTINS